MRLTLRAETWECHVGGPAPIFVWEMSSSWTSSKGLFYCGCQHEIWVDGDLWGQGLGKHVQRSYLHSQLPKRADVHAHVCVHRCTLVCICCHRCKKGLLTSQALSGPRPLTEFPIQWKWPWDKRNLSFSVHPISSQLDPLQKGGLINSNSKLNYDRIFRV